MKEIPQFVLGKSRLTDLVTALKPCFSVEQVNVPKTTAEGIEQIWLCSDKSGLLFSFSSFEAKAGNALDLKADEVYLVLGPRAKGAPKRTGREISEACDRFESSVLALGGRRWVPMDRR